MHRRIFLEQIFMQKFSEAVPLIEDSQFRPPVSRGFGTQGIGSYGGLDFKNI